MKHEQDGIFIRRQRGDETWQLFVLERRTYPPDEVVQFWCPGCAALGEVKTRQVISDTKYRDSKPVKMFWTVVEPPQGWSYLWPDSAADSRSSEPDPPR